MKNRVFRILFGGAAVFMAAAFLGACNSDPDPSPSKPSPVNPDPDPNKPIAVTGLELNRTKLHIEEFMGETLIATIIPSNATATVTWSSANENIAIVNNNGVVSGVNYGNTVITASVGEITAKCIVSVFKSKGEFTQSELRTLY